MNKLLAYCGLDCEKCEARIATVNQDESLREKVAHAPITDHSDEARRNLRDG